MAVGERIAVDPGVATGAAFSLGATAETWTEFARPVPDVGFQSLVGMQRMGHLKVDGDMVAYGRNLLFLEQLFAALRPASRRNLPRRSARPSSSR